MPAKPASIARLTSVSVPFGWRSRAIEKCSSVTSPGTSSYVCHALVCVAKSFESIVALIAEKRAPDAPKSSSRSSRCFSAGSALRFTADDSVSEAPKPPIV